VRERLRALPLFADLDDEQLDRLATCTSQFDAPAGKVLIERGDPGSGIFVLEHGDAVVEAAEGEIELGPGAVFGERSVLGNQERSARVRAQTDVTCLAVARTELARILEEDAAFAERLRELAP
jgi:CRP-like cAMP-binding protein